MLNIEIIEGNQGTQEWNNHRIGSVGASSVSKIITSTGKKSTQRQAFMYQLAAETMTGIKTETYSNKYMEEGLLREDETLSAFAFFTETEIKKVSLIMPTSGVKYHCSPDAIVVDKNEGVEVKSVTPATQVKYLDKNVLPTEYKLQCMFSLMVTGWNIWHFFSHHPLLPPLYIQVWRDDKLIPLIQEAVEEFCADLKTLVERLR